VRRALRKPPRVLLRRVATELYGESERIRAPIVQRRFGAAQLLRATDAGSLDDLWHRLLSRVPFPPELPPSIGMCFDEQAILAAAERSLQREIDLLGSGPHTLGSPIDWHTDFKSGDSWPPRFFRSIEFGARGAGSDVKVPWELSRVQWLIPVGQAYLLTGDERYALAARGVLADWISANPFAGSVNWAVTMEVALRIVSWTWLLGALGQSESWTDRPFREQFMRSLYLHGAFTERHLERSDVNGNHYTADAAGLAIAGMVFGEGSAPRRWASTGWAILCEELPRQVHEDGVDFEASTAYHRLVAELFLLPALHRERLGLEVPEWFRERVRAMARFTAAYTRPDGSAPWWGDADDARALPLSIVPPDDHRHLVEVVATAWGGVEPFADAGPGRSEAIWLLGRTPPASTARTRRSSSFEQSGVYILAGERDHIFVDCGPVGLSGRGGHGHNDCLSIDVFLDGTQLVADPGSFVYTASWEWRNRFRRTAAHSTPQLDDAEQNRFVEGSLWLLNDDAEPEVRLWDPNPSVSRFVGAHQGYIHLAPPVTPVRTIELDTNTHSLAIIDDFEGSGSHVVSVPLQLASGVAVARTGDGAALLHAEDRSFELRWDAAADWTLDIGQDWVSPSYGVKKPATRLEWRRDGELRSLRLHIAPAGGDGCSERRGPNEPAVQDAD
jgi:uncharacterized heparinase superfamily protein